MSPLLVGDLVPPAVTLLLVFLPQVAVDLNWWKSRRVPRMEGRCTVISKDSSIDTREGKMIKKCIKREKGNEIRTD